MTASRSWLLPKEPRGKPGAFFERTDAWLPDTVDPMTCTHYKIKVRILSLTDNTPLCNNDAECPYCLSRHRHSEALCQYLRGPLDLSHLDLDYEEED